MILYTSGTTGTPKGAELTHSNLGRNVEGFASFTDIDETRVDRSARCRCFTPSARPAGSTPRSRRGACLTLIPRFDPGKALEIIQRDTVTVFEGVPTMYAAMLNHPDRDSFDTSSLELCASGGSAMPVEVMKAFEEAFDCKVLEGYGLSETSPVASFNHPDRERKPGSIGTPIEGVEMKVVDDDGNEVEQGEPGEIVIRGHNVMKGYWNRPEATEEAIDDDGWFKTGDMATDRRGRLLLHRRPQEGPDHPRRLQRLPARDRGGHLRAPGGARGGGRRRPARRPRRGGRRRGRAQGGRGGLRGRAREHVKEQVAAYKYPRRIWFVDELPKGPTGKILKREIEPARAPEISASRPQPGQRPSLIRERMQAQ